MDKFITDAELEALKKEYPKGTRVELTNDMNDPWNHELVKGSQGTVDHIDSAGSVHVHWDCGSSLAVLWGIDHIRKV